MLKVPMPAYLKSTKELTGSHVQEIYRTSRLLATQNGGDYKKHIDEAVKIVRDNFYLGKASKAGFTAGNENSDCKAEQCPPEKSCGSDGFLRRK